MANGGFMNKNISDFMGKLDEKVFKTKINSAIEMLKNGNTGELAKKLEKVDKKDLMEKLDLIDDKKIKELNLNKTDIKNTLESADIQEISKVLGQDGIEILNKLKQVLAKKT